MPKMVGRTLGQYEILEEIGHGDIYVTAEATVEMPAVSRLPIRRALPAWAWMGGAVVGVLLCVGAVVCGLALSGVFGSGAPATEPTNTPEPFRPALTATDCNAAGLPEAACTGVSSNADWEPVTQDFDGVEMALVPAGCFMMGSTDEQVDYAMELYGSGAERSWFEDEQPVHEVCFEEPFWIDVYEVTNGQYGSSGFFSGDNRPHERVFWHDATAHCESRGARLPTEAEWEYAARGPDGLVFPWGNEFVADNVVYSGNSGGQTANVGSRPGGASWVGAYDLSGNVWEWTSSPSPSVTYVVRGGSWNDDSSVLLRGANRNRGNPGETNSYYGFRCSRSYGNP